METYVQKNLYVRIIPETVSRGEALPGDGTRKAEHITCMVCPFTVDIPCMLYDTVFMVSSLRNRIPREEFDYQVLMDALGSYARPRARITRLLRDDVIVRVKKGLYIFGEGWRRRPYNRELLANLIYGPSYVSLEYALAWHGLIPERVETVTSVTCGRPRSFDTPVGRFTYRMVRVEAFHPGVDLFETGDGGAFLMATPEKALADKMVEERSGLRATQRELRSYLFENLRIDTGRLEGLDVGLLGRIAQAYRSRKVHVLAEHVAGLGRKKT